MQQYDTNSCNQEFQQGMNTSQETEKPSQLFLGLIIQEIYLENHHHHIFEYKWSLMLVYSTLQSAVTEKSKMKIKFRINTT